MPLPLEPLGSKRDLSCKLSYEITRQVKQKDTVEILIEDLQSNSDPSKRVQAARGLCYINDPKVVGPLIEALKDTDKNVRFEAIFSLKVFSLRVFSSLRVTSLPEIVDLFIQATKDPHFAVRSQAAEGLGQLGDKRAVKPLIELLKDVDYHVRIVAARALSSIQDPEVAQAIKPLVEAINTPSNAVIEAAAEALYKLKNYIKD